MMLVKRTLLSSALSSEFSTLSPVLANYVLSKCINSDAVKILILNL
jgi:hypothetical protein